MKSFADWLRGSGLAHHGPVLAENGIDFDVAPSLTEDDLRSLGLNLGDRRRLLQAIARLSEQPSAPLAEAADPTDTATKAVDAPPVERRQLTVMFCDLVGSTALAERLDPEELRALMQAYRKACGNVLARYEGYMAQYLGDGLMVYFGWPSAHEDDAERGVRSALEMVQAVKGVSAAHPLAVRIGVATGAVVVGEASSEDNAEAKLAVGETPNLAARLQGLAGPDEIVIAPATRRLVGDAFELADLGVQPLKGIAEPLRSFRVLRARATESRFEAAHGGLTLTPLVGREEEVALLLRRWQQARDGEGQVVLISGEPGIGKSRLTQALREHIVREPHIRLRYQCSPYHLNSTLYSIIEQFQFAAGFTREDAFEQKLDKMEAVMAGSQEQRAESAPLIAALLSLPTERYPPLKLSPQKQKEKTLEALAGQIEALARREPVLMVFEDAHWIDPTSQEALDVLVPRLHALPILLMITYRTEYTPHWAEHAHVTTLGLSRLGRRHGAALVAKVAGGIVLPAEVLEQIVAHTDGVPLFVEELTKSVLESGLLREADDRYALRAPLPLLAIPTSLRDSLLARLDRLAPVKEIAQIGACIGREFSFQLLARVSRLHTKQLEEAVKKLTEAGMVYRRGTPPDATYTFKHALVQDAAYDSLLKSKRFELHAQIAKMLEEDFSDTVANEPELLAHHFKQAGLNGRAVPYWIQAGQRSLAKTALPEAVSHLSEALELVQTLSPSTERDQSELQIRVDLARAQFEYLGWASSHLHKTLLPAQELAERLGDNRRLFETLSDLHAYYGSVPVVEMARDYARRMLALGAATNDGSMIVRGHMACAVSECIAGNWRGAKEHGDHVLQLYDYERDAIHMSGVLAWAPHWYWALGMPEQAAAASTQILEIAEHAARPFFMIWALTGGSVGLIHTGDTKRALEWNLEARKIAREHAMRFAETTLCNFWGGPALIADGQYLEGYEIATLGGMNWEATGGFTQSPYLHTLRAQALGMLNRAEEGIEVARRTLKLTKDSEHRTWEPITLVVLGQLLRSAHQPGDARLREAQDAFDEALHLSRSKSAKGFELIAATSLARLWQSQGKIREARELLASIYNSFTAGFNTKDLKEAKALLTELAV